MHLSAAAGNSALHYWSTFFNDDNRFFPFLLNGNLDRYPPFQSNYINILSTLYVRSTGNIYRSACHGCFISDIHMLSKTTENDDTLIYNWSCFAYIHKRQTSVLKS